MTPLKSTGEIRDIEALRAVAVLGVICQHINMLFPRKSLGTDWPSFLSGGWVGVDLFFAISGFVIARSFLPKAMGAVSRAEYRARSFAFWIKRLYRLTPSAWFWLLVILLLAATYNDSGKFGSVEVNAYWTLAGMLNFSNYLFTQYFGVQKPGASFVYWSLSLEEQFYLLFPLLVFVFRRHLVWPLLLLVLVQLPFQRGIYGMMFRTDAIALGVILAWLWGRFDLDRVHEKLGRMPCRLALLATIALLFWIGTYRQTDISWQVGAVALLSGIIVFLAGGRENLLAGESPLGRGLVWLGHRSYAMYLVHIPVILALYETAYRVHFPMAEYKVAAIAVAVSLVVVISGMNYRWLETPLRERGRRVAARVYDKYSGQSPGQSREA